MLSRTTELLMNRKLKIFNFQLKKFKTLSLFFTIYLFCCLEHYAWLGSSWFQDLFGTKKYGFSISAQSYDFCPCLAQLDNLDFTLSHKGSIERASRVHYEMNPDTLSTKPLCTLNWTPMYLEMNLGPYFQNIYIFLK